MTLGICHGSGPGTRVIHLNALSEHAGPEGEIVFGLDWRVAQGMSRLDVEAAVAAKLSWMTDRQKELEREFRSMQYVAIMDLGSECCPLATSLQDGRRLVAQRV